MKAGDYSRDTSSTNRCEERMRAWEKAKYERKECVKERTRKQERVWEKKKKVERYGVLSNCDFFANVLYIYYIYMYVIYINMN